MLTRQDISLFCWLFCAMEKAGAVGREARLLTARWGKSCAGYGLRKHYMSHIVSHYLYTICIRRASIYLRISRVNPMGWTGSEFLLTFEAWLREGPEELGLEISMNAQFKITANLIAKLLNSLVITPWSLGHALPVRRLWAWFCAKERKWVERRVIWCVNLLLVADYRRVFCDKLGYMIR